MSSYKSPSADQLRRVQQLPYLFRVCGTVAVCALLEACATAPRIPYTEAEARSSTVLGLSGLMRYSDEPISKFDAPAPAPVLSYLALSGGGADGAYGVGILNGWTAAGNRPKFSIVSGVSTGGLIAPFAFLGSSYDGVLREVYTSGIAESLLEDSNLLRVVFGAGLAGNARLRGLVGHYVDAHVLEPIAREYVKGRRLYVVTTDLDTQRTAIWDMGKIATIGSPAALKLFQDVMTPSASVPLVFPPVLIDAEANGKRFQEMHVDGGVTAPVLTLPDEYFMRHRSPARKSHVDMYLLVNNKIQNEFTLVKDSALNVASRSISPITKSQTRAIVFSTYDFAKRSNFSFSLSYIEREYPSDKRSEFDTTYMRHLYEYGFDKAIRGSAWRHIPLVSDETVAAVR